MIVICITALQLLLSFIFVESCRFPIAPFPPQTYGKVPEAKTLLGGGLIAKQLWTVTKYGLCWVMCKTQTINFPYYSVFFTMNVYSSCCINGFETNGAEALFISMGMGMRLKGVCGVIAAHGRVGGSFHWRKIIPWDPSLPPLGFQAKFLL